MFLTKKKSSIIIIFLLVLQLGIPYFISNAQNQPNYFVINNDGFFAENITLGDDAFHKPNTPLHIETWYFDAKLDNNRTIVFVYCLFQIHHKGFLLHGVYFYENATIEFIERKITRLSHCTISYDEPFLMIAESHSVQGYIDVGTGKWKYSIHMETKDALINLIFTRTAAGWMGTHLLGWWLAIPHFEVTGSIQTSEEMIQVSGTGYHDHNLYPSNVAFLTDGYHFGSFGGDQLRITWARLLKDHQSPEIFALLSEGESRFSLIPADDVQVSIHEYLFDHGKKIPKKWGILVNNEQVNINLSATIIDAHFIKIIGVRYWRYHLQVTGTMQVGSLIEHINTKEISELLYFF